MKIEVQARRWDWPFFTAEPSGFEYIEVVLQEPSGEDKVTATITLDHAETFANRLLQLCKALRGAVR